MPRVSALKAGAAYSGISSGGGLLGRLFAVAGCMPLLIAPSALEVTAETVVVEVALVAFRKFPIVRACGGSVGRYSNSVGRYYLLFPGVLL